MRKHRGLTLVEVLLVLGLLVILGAVAWPALDRPWAEQRLRKAADVVRLAWARAKVNAMSSGRTYVFRYEPQSDRYVVECWEEGDAEHESQPGEWFGQEQAAPAAPSLLATTPRTLPEGIHFVAGASQLDQRATFVLSTFGQEPAEAPHRDAAWSDPILFYPDGTATSAELQLANEHGRQMELSLRGLTGVVTVGEIHTAQER